MPRTSTGFRQQQQRRGQIPDAGPMFDAALAAVERMARQAQQLQEDLVMHCLKGDYPGGRHRPGDLVAYQNPDQTWVVPPRSGEGRPAPGT